MATSRMAVTAGAEAAFTSSRDRAEYWLFCAAVFLAFLTNSTTAYFSVILSAAGMSERVIGEILSSPLLPVPVAILISGPLIERYSARNVVIAGQSISLASFIGLQLALPSPGWVALCRMTLGLGFGIFFPAGMVYAKSKLRGPSTPYFFGIYAAMVTLPVVAAPSIAEWYLRRYGLHYLFWAMAVPLLLALPLMAIACTAETRARTRGRDPPPPAEGYLALLTRKSLLVPNLSIVVVGLMWGFAVSFMALFLFRSGLPAATFFSSCTTTLILSRVLVLRFLAHRSREAVVAGGMAGMAAAYGMLSAWPVNPLIVVIGGIVFGLGYSFTFPVLSVWVSDQFPPEARGRPVALFGALFHLGIFAVPVVVGHASAVVSLRAVLATLGAVALTFGIALLGSTAPGSPADRGA